MRADLRRAARYRRGNERRSEGDYAALTPGALGHTSSATVSSVRSQQESWRHHHAPQFYLNQWLDPATGRLLQYKRAPTGKLVVDKTTPKSTGYAEYLYTARPTTPWENWAPDQIETDFMSPLDNLAALAMKKMLDQPAGEAALDDEQVTAWALFIRSLLERHPRTLQEREAFAVEAGAALRKEYEQRLPTETVRRVFKDFDMEGAARNIVRTHMVQQIRDSEFLARYKDQQWVVVDTPDDPYITCDQPLLVTPVMDREIGKDPIYVMTLPISPRRLFVSYPKSWHRDPDWESALSGMATLHNLLVVASGPRYLYAMLPITNGKVARLRNMVDESFGVLRAAT